MLRLSKMADYAVVVLIRLGDDRESGTARPVQTSPGIAVATGVPEPTVAKVLKALAGAGLVISQRGAHGGYRLKRPLEAVAVADVIAAIDGPIAMAACVEGSTASCDVGCVCAVRGRWNLVNDAILQTLSAITLADMMRVPPALHWPDETRFPVTRAPLHDATVRDVSVPAAE